MCIHELSTILGNSPCEHRTQPIMASQRSRVQLLAQLAHPGSSVVQQVLQDSHGNAFPTEAENGDLGTVAQGRQAGGDLGDS
jgi:hypothetical protein